jgi:hypothetical protein
MINTFELLPDTSRIWIYQGNRKFTNKEEAEILEKTKRFVKDWNAHGNDLHSGAEILHHQFVILCVNENDNSASGCSIDKSVQFIRTLENNYGINFLDRSKIAYYKDEKILISSFKELKMKIDNGTITRDTLIFNNLVERKGDLEENWIIPARDSWINKYFNAN